MTHPLAPVLEYRREMGPARGQRGVSPDFGWVGLPPSKPASKADVGRRLLRAGQVADLGDRFGPVGYRLHPLGVPPCPPISSENSTKSSLEF